MSKKDFRLVRPVKDAYSTREVGYEDTFDYPNLYNEKTGEVGICGGHGIYAWAKREDYELLNQNESQSDSNIKPKTKMKINLVFFLLLLNFSIILEIMGYHTYSSIVLSVLTFSLGFYLINKLKKI